MFKNKQAYILLYILAAVPLAGVSVFFVGALIGGIAWLVLFGDAPWPTEQLDVVVRIAITFSALLVFILAGYLGHRRGTLLAQEGYPEDKLARTRNGLLATFFVPLLVPLLIMMRNATAPTYPETDACFEDCRAKGYTSAWYDYEAERCVCPDELRANGTIRQRATS